MKKLIKKPRETDIQNTILEWLQYQPGFYWRQNNQPRFDKTKGIFFRLPKFTPKGVPDILGVRKGVFISIEIKRSGAKQSQGQMEFESIITANRGTYILATCIEDVQKRFDELDGVQTMGSPAEPKRKAK